MDYLFRLLIFSASMSVIITLVWLISKFLSKKISSVCKYLIWAIVIIRMCVPFTFSFVPSLIKVESPETVFGAAVRENEFEPEPVPAPAEEDFNSVDNAISGTSDPIRSAFSAAPIVSGENAIPDAPYAYSAPDIDDTAAVSEPLPMPEADNHTSEEPAVTFTEPEADAPSLTAGRISIIILSVYFGIGLSFYLFCVVKYAVSVGKIKKYVKAPDADLCEIYSSVCAQMSVRRPPVLRVGGKKQSPMLCGVICKYIVIPDIVLTRDEFDGILRHELTHYKRKDILMKFIGMFAVSVNYLNPFVYLAASRLEKEMEYSCDELVLRGNDDTRRRVYGTAMLNVIKECRADISAFTAGFKPGKREINRRFSNIMDGGRKKKGMIFVAFVVSVCLFASSFVSVTYAKAENETPDEIEADTAEDVTKTEDNTEETNKTEEIVLMPDQVIIEPDSRESSDTATVPEDDRSAVDNNAPSSEPVSADMPSSETDRSPDPDAETDRLMPEEEPPGEPPADNAPSDDPPFGPSVPSGDNGDDLPELPDDGPDDPEDPGDEHPESPDDGPDDPENPGDDLPEPPDDGTDAPEVLGDELPESPADDIPEPEPAYIDEDAMAAMFEEKIARYPGSAKFRDRVNSGIHIVMEEDAIAVAQKYYLPGATKNNNVTSAAYYRKPGVWYVTSYSSAASNRSVGTYGLILTCNGKLLSIWEGDDNVPFIDYSHSWVTRGPVGQYSELTVEYPSDGTIQSIETWFRDFYRAGLGSAADRVYVSRYYGEYSGAYAIMVKGPFHYPENPYSEVIAGYYFRYPGAPHIKILKDGCTYRVSEAYYFGIITEDDVARLSLIHAAGRFISYEM